MSDEPSAVACSEPSAARRALDRFAAFSALSAAEKLAVAAEIVAELGGDFRAGAALVGEAALPTLIHLPSETELVLIPGGTFVMGFTADDRAAVERFFGGESAGAVFALVEKQVPAMTPTREVRVRPFALARRPLATMNALLAPGDARVGRHPGALSRDEIDALLAQHGFRLPSEAEWEFVVREGRGGPFLLDVAQAFWEGTDERAETAWGIAELGASEWVGDRWHDSYEGAPADGEAWTTGDGAWMARGAFACGIRGMQSNVELTLALSAYRCPPGRVEGGVRLALSPDEAGTWRLTARATPIARPRVVPAAPDAPAPQAPAPAPSPAPAPTAAATAFRLACQAVDGLDLEAAIAAIGTAEGALLHRVVRRCLSLCDYPIDAPLVPLAEELTETQRRVMVATTGRRGIGWTLGAAFPGPAQIRRRWLGLARPSVIERLVEVSWQGSTVRWPFWKAWGELGRVGRDDERWALLPSLVDRFEAAIRINVWRQSMYGMSPDAEASSLVDKLGPAGASRASALLDQLLATHHPALGGQGRLTDGDGAPIDLPSPPVDETVWGTLSMAVVLGGSAVAERWDPILPFVTPYVETWIRGVAPARQEQVLLAAFRRTDPATALPTALRLLRTHRSPALAEEITGALASRASIAAHGVGQVRAWTKAWEELRALRGGASS